MMKNSYNLQKTSFQALIALVGSYADPNESFRGYLLRFRCGIIRNTSRSSLFSFLTACFIDIKRFTARSSHRQSFGVEFGYPLWGSPLRPLYIGCWVRSCVTCPYERTRHVHKGDPHLLNKRPKTSMFLWATHTYKTYTHSCFLVFRALCYTIRCKTWS